MSAVHVYIILQGIDKIETFDNFNSTPLHPDLYAIAHLESSDK